MNDCIQFCCNGLTFARASRDASASAAMALWSWRGSLTSFISTLSTLMPHTLVASSKAICHHDYTKLSGSGNMAPFCEQIPGFTAEAAV